MDIQVAFNILLGICGAFGGWILNRVASDINHLRQALTQHREDVADVRVQLPTFYATKVDVMALLDRVMDSLQRIEDKIDSKVSRSEIRVGRTID